ncbi:hypothetical protein F442_17163 [Phytophthora nicotianae P10297]|uniref:Uncharacterized protein n=1 Tax=Phytophthora nicotianae P10297 TaxID=1317064 RepID=W2YHK1_PHYNI|nr:hypothetical protein F442_17163 [Phytophthora nicotianae P10297]
MFVKPWSVLEGPSGLTVPEMVHTQQVISTTTCNIGVFKTTCI